jgi:hypothetical protein
MDMKMERFLGKLGRILFSMDRLLLSSSSNKTLGLLIEIQSLIEEIALKFQQESL